MSHGLTETGSFSKKTSNKSQEFRNAHNLLSFDTIRHNFSAAVWDWLNRNCPMRWGSKSFLYKAYWYFIFIFLAVVVLRGQDSAKSTKQEQCQQQQGGSYCRLDSSLCHPLTVWSMALSFTIEWFWSHKNPTTGAVIMQLECVLQSICAEPGDKSICI